VDVALESRYKPIIEPMGMRGESYSESSVVSCVSAQVRQLAKECRLSAAEPHSKATVGVQLGQPTHDGVGVERATLFRCVAVWAGEIASIRKRNRYLARGARPRAFGWDQFVHQNVESGRSIEEMHTRRSVPSLKSEGAALLAIDAGWRTAAGAPRSWSVRS